MVESIPIINGTINIFNSSQEPISNLMLLLVQLGLIIATLLIVLVTKNGMKRQSEAIEESNRILLKEIKVRLRPILQIGNFDIGWGGGNDKVTIRFDLENNGKISARNLKLHYANKDREYKLREILQEEKRIEDKRKKTKQQDEQMIRDVELDSLKGSLNTNSKKNIAYKITYPLSSEKQLWHIVWIEYDSLGGTHEENIFEFRVFGSGNSVSNLEMYSDDDIIEALQDIS